jgi:hypothetical protein
LRVAVSGLAAEERNEVYRVIVSYLVRRAFCGLTAKNYNNVFMQLLKQFAGAGATLQEFQRVLAEFKADASRWPRDEEFRHAWLTVPAHDRLGDVARVRFVLTQLENGLRSPQTEQLFAPTDVGLDVDHILPDKWFAHWPLSGEPVSEEDASVAVHALFASEPQSPRIDAILKRQRLKTTIGNLTLVHYGVNRALQNGPFEKKRDAFFKHSNLHLNRDLMLASIWDEATIEARSKKLFEVARNIWIGPQAEEPK